MKHDRHNATQAIHEEENPYGDVIAPFDLSITSTQPQIGGGDYFYGRIEHPAGQALENKLAVLEHAEHALAFGTGMAAIHTTIRALLSPLKPGDEIIFCDNIYSETRILFKEHIAKVGINIKYVDTTFVKNITERIGEKTKIIFLESPSNPLLKLCPIAEIAALKKEHPNLIVMVDNTFATPLGQKPLKLDADISLHSLTKYIGGHSDAWAGAIMTNNKDYFERIKKTRGSWGTNIHPLGALLLARGAETLHTRMKQHEHNAIQIAQFLQHHPRVEYVLYPGLPSHPQYALGRKQMSNFGGMVTFKLKGARGHLEIFCKQLRLFTYAVNLGSVESLIETPAFMTHAQMSQSERDVLGIPDTLIRVSVGIEDVRDLINDLDQALSISNMGHCAY